MRERSPGLLNLPGAGREHKVPRFDSIPVSRQTLSVVGCEDLVVVAILQLLKRAAGFFTLIRLRDRPDDPVLFSSAAAIAESYGARHPSWRPTAAKDTIQSGWAFAMTAA